MTQPAALAHEAIYETVLKVLDGTGRGKLLDVPAGHGALAARLIAEGFDVTCSDLYPEIFQLEGPEIVRSNLDDRLPFGDASFETVVCIEGLEHIENPANAIREFSRILSDDGVLVVSVPNIMNIEERFKWLISGYTSHFKPITAEKREEASRGFAGMEEIALHVNPIGYSEVRYLLEKNGLQIVGVFRDKAKANSWAFRPIVAAIRLVSGFSSPSKRSSTWADELNSDEVLLGGNTLIFKARKV